MFASSGENPAPRRASTQTGADRGSRVRVRARSHWDACPIRIYRQADAEYSGRVRAAELICLAFYADVNYLLRKMIVAEAVSASVPGMIIDAMTKGYAAGYTDAGGNVDELKFDDPDELAQRGALVLEHSKRLREAVRGPFARQAAAQWEGFSRFAREDVGVEVAVEQLPTNLVIDGKRVRGRLEQPRGCAEIQLLLAPWLR